MLNRRLLRSKTVQALYSSQIADNTNRSLAYDEIETTFKPDLNSMLPQNKTKLEGMRKMASIALDELLGQRPTDPNDEAVPKEAAEAAVTAYSNYQKNITAENNKLLKRTLQETELIHYEFLMMLHLLLDVEHQAMIESDKKGKGAVEQLLAPYGLHKNEVIGQLRNSKEFEAEVIRKAVSWSNNMDIVRAMYRNQLPKDEKYQEYIQSSQHTFEEDVAISRHILLKVFFKDERVTDFFDQRDLYWNDHQELVRDMLSKTVKGLARTGDLKLAVFTEDWEEDVSFVEEIFKKTLGNNDRYENYLADQLKNWQTDRVALVDAIIMKAALTEMIYFPNIPVKVTINEYIEVAKRYSTPQSGKFINGVLDVLSNKLRDEGIIKKSGRGLIDNR